MAEYKNINELLGTGAGTEGQLLIQRKIYDELIESVEKNLIPRSEAARYIGPSGIPGSSVDVDLESENSLDVRKIAEGAEIYRDVVGYTSTNLKPVKYGVQIRITKEMMEDAKWDLLSHGIKVAGKRMAENETSLILTALQACTNNVSGGASITIPNITRAIQYLRDNDYTPTTLLIGPEVLNDLMNIDTFVEANKVGNTEMLSKGFIGTVYGLNVLMFSANAAPSTTYSKYAYVIDNQNAYMIAEKRPVSTENFDLPNYDMSGAIVTQRIVVSLLRDNACARISTS